MPDKKTGLMFKSLISTSGLILAAVMLVFLNIIISSTSFRWDVTSDKVYSLSKGSQDILQGLDQNITLKLFYTKGAANIPLPIKTYARRLTDFLMEYKHAANGKIAFKVYNPKVDSEEEEWAQKYGIEGIQLSSGETVYFGLVAEAADQEAVIPFLDPAREQHLEYDITRMIADVQDPKQKKIGIISGFPIFGSMPANFLNPAAQQKPWSLVTELKKSYQVVDLSLETKSIEDDLDLLVIIHPKGFDEALLYAVDQYVLKGGNLIVFQDPLAVADRSPAPLVPGGPSLGKLFSAWGVRIKDDKVVADFNLATALRGAGRGVENNPFWLSLQSDSFGVDNTVTGQLGSMLMPVCGAFEKLEGAQNRYEALLQSSSQAALVSKKKARFSAAEIRRSFKPAGKKLDLAVQIRGNFKTAFPEGPPEPETPDKTSENGKETDRSTPNGHLSESRKSSTIILVADADLLFDRFYMDQQSFLGLEMARVFNDNLNFFLNAIEILTGRPELISIRSRGRFEKPFTRVQALARRAQTKWLQREQELVRKMEETNRTLKALEQRKDASQKVILSAEQESEIRNFKAERLRINKALKTVRRNLRSEIESLGNWLKFLNIFVAPFLICIVGIIYALHKRKHYFVADSR